MRSIKGVFCAVLLILAFVSIIFGIAGCSGQDKNNFDINSVNSYLDIPGVTSEEIAAIEEVKISRKNFTYGQMYETEAFIKPDGTYGGFAPEFCKLLTALFGIEFTFEFYEWETLINGITNKEIDFTGDLTPTEERREVFYMTYPIAERTQRIFMLQENYNNFRTEKDADGLTIGYLMNSIDAQQIKRYYPELAIAFTGVYDIGSAVELLEARVIDAFATEGVLDPVFDNYEFIRSKEFFHLAYSPVSMATANPKLNPFITVMNKYLAAGGIDVLFNLYRQGDWNYAMYKLAKSFTAEEQAYIDNLINSGETVKAGMESDNYPVSFYDKTKKKFDGIVPDVLMEIEKLTGITFEIANEANTPWAELFDMLKAGEISLVSELLYSQEREGLFRWSDVPYVSSNYVLISRHDYPNLLNYQVVRTKVGALEGTGYADKYREWFPANDNLVYYKTAEDVFKALEAEKIDLIAGSDHMLLMQQNFYQNPGFKINIRFSEPMNSYFGFNLKEEMLCSIICKTMDYIDNVRIAQSWTSRGYDYVSRMNRMRMIYAFVIAAITALLFIRMFFFNRRLHKLVSERTQLLEQQTIAAQAASKAKSTFLANMSHEIRTPMNAILGITEILLQDETIGEKAEEALEKIYDSGDILMGIINDILDLSKIEEGKLELVVNKYDIPSLINDTIQLNRMRYEFKPIKFFLRLDENTPMNLYGDELRIKQILNNILSNAYKYTETGSIEMSVFAEKINNKDEIKNDDNNVMLVFRVSDTGQGMTDEQIGRLFDEYIRFNLDTNRTIAGTGLGMSITKRLVNIMNGQLIVKSEPGKGSVFTVKLPQKNLNSPACGKETAEKLQSFNFQSSSISKNSQMYREYMPYGSVLVVDDVKTNIFVTRGMLLPYGLKVDTASSGFEAIEKIKAGAQYDIIFMDHMMPKMDGIETTRQIREWESTQGTGDVLQSEKAGHDSAKQNSEQQNLLPITCSLPHVPIIALTANALVGHAEMFLKNGFDGYISKPIDTRELNQILNEFIRNKKPALSAPINKETSDRSEVEKFFILDAEKTIAVLEGLWDNLSPEKIRKADPDSEELSSFDIAVHGIKTALSNIGETELADSALIIEKAAMEKNLALIAEEAPAFLKALKELLKKLVLKAEAGLVHVNILIDSEDAAMLNEKLNILKIACSAYDIKAAKNVLYELKQKTWPQEICDLIDEINVHLLHSAFAKAVATIENISDIH